MGGVADEAAAKDLTRLTRKPLEASVLLKTRDVGLNQSPRPQDRAIGKAERVWPCGGGQSSRVGAGIFFFFLREVKFLRAGNF